MAQLQTAALSVSTCEQANHSIHHVAKFGRSQFLITISLKLRFGYLYPQTASLNYILPGDIIIHHEQGLCTMLQEILLVSISTDFFNKIQI